MFFCALVCLSSSEYSLALTWTTLEGNIRLVLATESQLIFKASQTNFFFRVFPVICKHLHLGRGKWFAGRWVWVKERGGGGATKERKKIRENELALKLEDEIVLFEQDESLLVRMSQKTSFAENE